MFGWTKREQRWKAEQEAAELIAGLAAVAVRANADVRMAEAMADAAELRRLRAENAKLRALLSDTPLSPRPGAAEAASR